MVFTRPTELSRKGISDRREMDWRGFGWRDQTCTDIFVPHLAIRKLHEESAGTPCITRSAETEAEMD